MIKLKEITKNYSTMTQTILFEKLKVWYAKIEYHCLKTYSFFYVYYKMDSLNKYRSIFQDIPCSVFQKQAVKYNRLRKLHIMAQFVELGLFIFLTLSIFLGSFSFNVFNELTRNKKELFIIPNKTLKHFETNLFGFTIYDQAQNKSGIFYDFRSNPIAFGASQFDASIVNTYKKIDSCYCFMTDVSVKIVFIAMLSILTNKRL